MIQLRKYQKNILNEIYLKFKTCDRLTLALSTGGGKTFIFSFLSQWWCKTHDKKVLILCHRTELISQTIASLNQIGVTCEAITAKTKFPKHNCSVYVAMSETANNRLKKNCDFFENVGLVIADEAHYQSFNKIFKYFPDVKILGVTATPVVLKRVKYFKCKFCKSTTDLIQDCCGEEMQEWTRPFAMADVYDDIVLGPPIDELIREGILVPELPFVKHYTDDSGLEVDSDGEFTTQSIDKAYSKDDAVFNVYLNYMELCYGKKTIIFNASTKTNLILYNKFKDNGLNVRMFDSVNSELSGSRKELIEWFREEEDAVLLNVGIFVAGFDVKEVEAIILNRPTNSLSLFIQMCGRGARSTDKIFKDKFILVDGGGNIERHQEFSDPTRDWRKIFFEGLGEHKPKKIDAFDIESCEACGYLYPKNLKQCPDCGHEVEPPPKKEKSIGKESSDVLQPIRKIPPPNGEKIYQYTLSKNEDVNFAFKILIGQIFDMFLFYRVSKEKYINTKNNGKLLKRVKTLIQRPYFVLISKKDISASNNRTINYIINKVLEKLEKYYEK